MTTSKMEKKPAVVMDKEPVDPTLCTCANATRRWDTDGLIEENGERWYRCSACGKKYR